MVQSIARRKLAKKRVAKLLRSKYEKVCILSVQALRADEQRVRRSPMRPVPFSILTLRTGPPRGRSHACSVCLPRAAGRAALPSHGMRACATAGSADLDDYDEPDAPKAAARPRTPKPKRARKPLEGPNAMSDAATRIQYLYRFVARRACSRRLGGRTHTRGPRVGGALGGENCWRS